MLRLAPIQLNKLLPHVSSEEFTLVQQIVRNGCLKVNKPSMQYFYMDQVGLRVKKPNAPASYLWAAVAYHVSPYKKDLATPPDYRLYLTSREAAVRLNEIAELICKNVPKEFHYGLVARGEK